MTLLAEVVRSGYVESTHHGSLVAVRGDGTTVLAIGDLTRPVFPRSSNKPLQAIGLLDAGWDPTDDRHLALACASHSGEPGHLEGVEAMLADVGLGALRNTPGLPLNEDAAHEVLRQGHRPCSLFQNCSGKHAAMLLTCVVNDWPLEGYLDQAHPVQQACRAGVERLAGEAVQHVAVDGCGAPQHALTLTGLARAYSALGRASSGAEARTASAMKTHPWYVGGTGRDVTALMTGVPGLVAKDGAEGVYAAGLADGSAVALKVGDGAGRARAPIMAAALRALGVAADVLDELARGPVLGGGRRVGDVRVAGALADL